MRQVLQTFHLLSSCAHTRHNFDVLTEDKLMRFNTSMSAIRTEPYINLRRGYFDQLKSGFTGLTYVGICTQHLVHYYAGQFITGSQS